ncbi:Crp/Fnr family transcriptional regulator [Microvirga aerophila]|uniref:Crp/Fnr family transcriptional regulator n=1 Tax=Microvirga aerophila TaxID=670291 RepID=A0A512C2D9_9HYPH|nr:Crp/Fnr family transcriptional regulator [Microvirga aerophila]GEO18382.1 Crp/Fnr family transcriptional regulator [Microvirga aerophila]
MISLLIRKLEWRDIISDEEKQALEDAAGRVFEVQADDDMVRDGDRPNSSTLLLEGFAARYKLLSNGKRQITAIHVPGDFIDLHSFLLKTMDHSIVALTPCRICLFPHDGLRDITGRMPHLGRLLWLNTLIDGAIHREWLVAMGRRPALSQIAHLICELFLRLQIVGLTDDYSFRLPLTQAELGDALGLSTVHVNRTIQELRANGLVAWRGDMIHIEDWPRLQQFAEFDPTFLNLENEPR